MSQRLAGTVIAITGGGSGIGAAFAHAMAREGARIGVLDFNPAGAEAVAASIRHAGGEAIALEVDVRDRAGLRAALERVRDEHGRFDVMFNNAGISQGKPFMETTEDDFRALHEVNVLGVLIGMQEAARILIEQGEGGRIVNTCSIAARQANAGYSAYAASKFAVRSLVQSGARALAEHGITVTGFAPGVVDTPLWRRSLGDSEERRLQAFAEYEAKIPAGRVSTPEDIVPVGIFLASAESNYTTGQVVAIDGGMTMV